MAILPDPLLILFVFDEVMGKLYHINTKIMLNPINQSINQAMGMHMTDLKRKQPDIWYIHFYACL